MDNLVKSINPYSLETISEYETHSDNNVSKIINSLDGSYQSWKLSKFEERKKVISTIKTDLEENLEVYARLITNEMGKPISQSIDEIKKCAVLCNYYIENAEKALADIEVNSKNKKSFISFRPLGVLLAVMPWNFPFWQVLRFAIPAIMAGNVVVLKHASNVTGCGLKIEEIFEKCSKDIILLKTIIINSKKVSKILENDIIRGATLTGSVEAGKSIAENAGKNLKKLVLELGGNDPYIVFRDADLRKAAKICVKSKMINGGQTCISAKRFIIEEDVYDEFLEKFTNEITKYIPAPPLDKNSMLSTMVSVEAKNHLYEQVQLAIDNGANCLLGGEVLNPADAFFPPTILSNISKDNPIYDQEIFGPVALFYKVKNEDEAIELANDSSFGLGAAIFTKDIDKAKKIARDKIEAGSCFINDFVKSDPMLPFGGIKDSGFGRELGEFGIREFTNIKTIVVN